MSTFHILNFGCRATQADGAAIERQLLDRGYARAEEAACAEVVVINTCTVTKDADAQARQAIRRAHRENPAARICVTGCYAQRAPDELAQIEGVTWVVGNSHKPQIPTLLTQRLLPVDAVARDSAHLLVGDIFAQFDVLVAPVLGGENDHTRPVLKIQDGCNARCSFCVIPFVRGRSRSLPPEQVLAEIRKLASAGYKEVVLSGINLGSYGRDLMPREELVNLLQAILEETPIARLRVSSVEPEDITREFVELLASSERMARHFHVPLQSGSNRILAAMHRWYRAEHYARRVELIRELVPEAAIGADLITGFPGETDDDHRATLRLVEQLPFTYLHVFAFSKRPGTKAAEMVNEVVPRVIKQRSQELRALAAEKGAAFRAAQIGKTLRVLTLTGKGGAECQTTPASKEAGYIGHGWTQALSDNYLKIRVAGSWPANTLLDATIVQDMGSYLTARA